MIAQRSVMTMVDVTNQAIVFVSLAGLALAVTDQHVPLPVNMVFVIHRQDNVTVIRDIQVSNGHPIHGNNDR